MKQDLEKFVERYPTYIEALEMLEQKDQRIAELEQELAELKEKDNYHLRYELAGADETITNLKEQLAEKDIRIEELEGQFAYECECNKQLVELQKQLAEKQNTIDEINKEFVQSIHDWKALCAEKDKEIERLKNLFELNNEVVINQGKEMFDLRVQVLQQKQNQIQLAIQELEKVHAMLVSKAREVVGTGVVAVRLYTINEVIDQQIKELKGE